MIIITGASSGIGLEVAKLYANDNKKVVNVSLHPSDVAAVNLVHDLSKGLQLKQAIQVIESIDEPIEAIINCVGVYSDETFGKMDEASVDRLMATNIKAPMLFISELLNRIKQDGADVLNVVSRAATQGNAGNPIYVASKWGERGFTLSLQDALKETPSRVISFCPGGIKTDLFQKADAKVDTDGWMSPQAIALFIKQILELPKNMEVSEVIINRKPGK